ncbi:tensin-3-like isoform X1 [Apis mellifera caucasica]|nr:tensin-3-like isoform X1 [Apis mellifera caucasica]KAG9432542.1 tensin-3-like isoform X1 [Apis mellifera carnica]
MGGKEEEEAGDVAVKMPEATLKIFNGVQYMGSFPVAIPDIASRAEYVRSQLETLREVRKVRRSDNEECKSELSKY